MTTAVIITCRHMLMSRSRLMTYKSLFSGREGLGFISSFNVSCPPLRHT